MKDNTIKLIREGHRRGEQRLEALLSMGLAADARAMSYGSVMIGVAAILGGLASNTENVWPVIVSAVILVAAAGLAIFSAQPVDFYAPGGLYSNLEDDISEDSDFYEVVHILGQQGEKYCLENQRLLARNGKLMNLSLLLSVFAPIAGLLTHFLF